MPSRKVWCRITLVTLPMFVPSLKMQTGLKAMLAECAAWKTEILAEHDSTRALRTKALLMNLRLKGLADELSNARGDVAEYLLSSQRTAQNLSTVKQDDKEPIAPTVE